MRLLATLIITLLGVTTAFAEEGTELFDPATGAVVTVPEDWTFAAEEQRLIAVSPDRAAMLLLAEAGSDFEEEALRIEKVIDRHLSDVSVQEAVILLGADRGALRGAVAARGTGLSRRDGRPVTFFALLVKDAEGDGGLVLGAWKEDRHADTVKAIVNSVQVREPGLVQGLALRDKRTGAAVVLPQKWTAYASRFGVVAMEPERRAMAILMAPERDFRETVAAVRLILRERVFEDVTVGELTRVTGVAPSGIADIMQATGTAKDRIDGSDVEFIVMVGQQVEANRGVLIIGAWKDPAFKEPLAKMLESLHLPER